ncbi:MAG TPA: nitroreductase family deazaflavin-dependent oxidoreductase [Phototrophicaceae bacterium]|jgi:deazaflavin-dependent oxidoreductase (nitroreductase family)|nr:nitroreductase family deazaflavin-dependent oxidoreductase [Phototrophicaceae bacterium]
MAEKPGSSSSFRGTMMKAFRNFHVFLYHISGGKLGGSINGSPLLLLTVTGRKSGQPHTMPLAYIYHNGEYLISASAAGAEKNPVWLTNLESKPDAKIEVSGKTYNVHATVATGAERDQLYELFKAQGDNFAEYEKKTTRKIPVIRLKPV